MPTASQDCKETSHKNCSAMPCGTYRVHGHLSALFSLRGVYVHGRRHSLQYVLIGAGEYRAGTIFVQLVIGFVAAAVGHTCFLYASIATTVLAPKTKKICHSKSPVGLGLILWSAIVF